MHQKTLGAAGLGAALQKRAWGPGGYWLNWSQQCTLTAEVPQAIELAGLLRSFLIGLSSVPTALLYQGAHKWTLFASDCHPCALYDHKGQAFVS